MFTLFVLLTLYCIIHSVLADFEIMKKWYFKWWYRFFYVVQSNLLLIPPFVVYLKIESDYVLNYPFIIKLILFLIQIFAVAFSIYAAKSYDNMSFLGFTQIKNFLFHGEEEFREKGLFELDGALKYVRHPYYFSGLVLIWARPLKGKDLIVNFVFTLYFILGAYNEERKLLKYFGNAYEEYRQKVPMLIPTFLRFKKWK